MKPQRRFFRKKKTFKSSNNNNLNLNLINSNNLINTNNNNQTKTIEQIFEKIYKNSNSKDERFKRLNAVLTAIDQIIIEKKTTPTPNAYFALLFTSLADNWKKTTENEASMLLYLIAILIPNVTIAGLRTKFSTIATVFCNLIDTNCESLTILQPLIKCIGYLIRAQDHSNPWLSQGQTLKLFNFILTITIDSRQKLRKSAIKAIRIIAEFNSFSAKECAEVIFPFCEKLFNNSNETDLPNRKKENLLIQSTLLMLTSVLPVLHRVTIASLSQTIIENLLNGVFFTQQMVITGFECLTMLFNDPKSNISFETTAKLYEKIYELQSLESSSIVFLQFIQLLTSATIKLISFNPNLNLENLSIALTTLVDSYYNEDIQVSKCLTENIKKLINSTIDISKINIDNVNEQNEWNTASIEETIANFAEHLQNATLQSYKSNWSQLLIVLTVFFQKLGPYITTFASELFKQTGSLLETMNSNTNNNKIPITPQLEQAFEAAIIAIGPKETLELFPIYFEDDAIRLPRVWILPFIKHHTGTKDKINPNLWSFEYFANTIVFWADQIKELQQKAISKGHETRSRHLRAIYVQIWDLFTCFSQASDVAQHFPIVARRLGIAISDEPPLRISVLNGLIQLIEHNKTNLQSQNESIANLAKQNINSIAQYSKNFLPILFNLYSTVREEQIPLPTSIIAFVSISSKELVNTFFSSVVAKLIEATKIITTEAKSNNNNNNNNNKEIKKKSNKLQKLNDRAAALFLSDLTCCFIQSLNQTSLKLLYKAIKPQLLQQIISDYKLEKKSYKILSLMCQYHPKFVYRNIDKLLQVVLGTLNSCSSPSKKSRLRCISSIVKSLPVNNEKLLKKLTLKKKKKSSKSIKKLQDSDMQTDDIDIINNDDNNNNDNNNNDNDAEIDGNDNDAEIDGNVDIEYEINAFKKLFAEIVAEVILCTKEKNNKARKEAYNTLIEMAEKLRQNPLVENQPINVLDLGIKEFFLMVLAGLAGKTPFMISASTLALSRLLFEFQKYLDAETLIQLIDAVTVLLKSPNREIVTSILGFCKVVIVSINRDILESVLQTLVSRLVVWANEAKNQFRTKIRILFERLVRKFGFDKIATFLPPSESKLMAYIKKEKQRKK
eukprot:TRINITY_DN469_c0_g1_i6.p1 TRINITY_DN469_c0_g1~~TRINITY_DN469_c0_g1_i6.p1  ORF type:complete len:1145 (-),score=498.18 TRINITY_DN469_c0_g1_i6:22-3396(-)